MSSARKRARSQRVAKLLDDHEQHVMLLKHHNSVITALAEEMARRLDRTQRGNTKLIEALMGMVNQNFTKGHSGGLAPSFMSCDEGAIEVLIEAGFAEQVEMGNYVLFWDKLEERKRDEQKT